MKQVGYLSLLIAFDSCDFNRKAISIDYYLKKRIIGGILDYIRDWFPGYRSIHGEKGNKYKPVKILSLDYLHSMGFEFAEKKSDFRDLLDISILLKYLSKKKRFIVLKSLQGFTNKEIGRIIKPHKPYDESRISQLKGSAIKELTWRFHK